jgi:hypothetical protein
MEKWQCKDHLNQENIDAGREGCLIVNRKLSFDFNWFSTFFYHASLHPMFERKVLEEIPDGSKKMKSVHPIK